MKKTRLLILGLIGTTLVLAVVQIMFSALFTTAGIDLSKLQADQKTVEKENTLLSEQLYAKEAFITIEQEAKDQGFSENVKARIVMSSPAQVALR